MAAEANSTGFLLSLVQTFEWQWYYILYMILFWEAKRIFKLASLIPSNVKINGPSTIFGYWAAGFKNVIYVEGVVSNAYEKCAGRIWATPTRDNFKVVVPSQKYIEEFDRAPQNVLSIRGVSHDMFPNEILFGGEPSENPGIFQKIFKADLRQYLPQLQPVLQEQLHEAFEKDFGGAKNKEGWAKVPLFISTFQMVARLNCQFVLGQDLSKKLFKSGKITRYLKMVTGTSQLLGILPRFMKPFLGNIIMRYFSDLNEIQDEVANEIRRRTSEPNESKYMDCIQWTMDRLKKENVPPASLSAQILGVLFASTHQMPMLLSFAIYRLCLHPEYIEALQDEARLCVEKVGDFIDTDAMPIMDSFLKEVGRLHPNTIVTFPHKTEKPFTFSDGCHIPAGNWVCVPQKDILSDPAYYSDPENFQPFRFVQWDNENGGSRKPSSESRFSNPTWKWPYWGTPKQACPARSYVSMMAKMTLAHLVLNYDFHLPDKNATATLNWGLAIAPHPSLSMLMRKKSIS